MRRKDAGRGGGLTAFARALKALSDPVRLRMVGVLAEGRESCELPDLCTRNVPGEGTPAGLCVCELQEQFGLSQSRTSYTFASSERQAS